MDPDVPTRDELLSAVTRALGLDRSPVAATAYHGRAWWEARAREHPAETTWLSALVSAGGVRRMRIRKDRPHAFHAERAWLVRDAPEELRPQLMAELEQLWAHVPYLGDADARALVLRVLDAPVALVRLADTMAAHPPSYASAAELPSALLVAGDDVVLASAELARRVKRAPVAALGGLPLHLVPASLRRYLDGADAGRLWRRLGSSHGASLALIEISTVLAGRRRLSLGQITTVLDWVDELVVLAGLGDDDPFGTPMDPSTITISEEAVEELEERIRCRFDAAVIASGPEPDGPAMRRAARTATRGLNGLVAVLTGARRHGVRIEAVPSVRLWLGPGSTDLVAVGDETHLDPGTLARLVAFGIDVLARPGHEPLLAAWCIAWATGCRPRECVPHSEDFSPLGRHWALYIDPTTGKTGARELYLPASAVAVLGIGPAWCSSRRWADRGARRPRFHHEVSETQAAEAAETLRTACRIVRAAWRKSTGDELPDRVAYLTRKATADLIRRQCWGTPWVVTAVLGHASGVTDTPYTRLTRSERAAMHGGLIEGLQALRQVERS